MVIQNPKQLVDEFKKSGEFDRLRRQLLTHFANSDEVRPLMSRVEEIARDKLSSDERLEHKTREAVHSEVMQDMERYPIVERAVADLAVLKDEALVTSIEQYVRNIVRGESNEDTKLWKARTSRRRKEKDEDENDGESSEYTEDEDPDDDELLIITEADRKNAATSSSPHPENSISPGHALQNGRSSPWLNHQDGIKPSLSHPNSPRTSPPTQHQPARIAPQTPPWLVEQDIRPFNPGPASPNNSLHGGNDSRSTLGVPSSDSLAEDLLVNGVPVGGSASDDGNEAKDGSENDTSHFSREVKHKHSTESARTHSAYPLGEGEGQIPFNVGQVPGPSAAAQERRPDIEMNDVGPSFAQSNDEQLPLQTSHIAPATSPPPNSSPSTSPPPYRSPTRSPTRSASPLLPSPKPVSFSP